MDAQTIDTYNAHAHTYDQETQDFWDKFPSAFLDTFAEHAQFQVLDVGSGPGRDALLLDSKGLEVICVDASRAMVDLCIERGLTAIEGDLLALPFPDHSFDGVWSYTSFLHLPRHELGRALAEAHRVLRINGVLGLGMIEGDTEEYRENMGEGAVRLFTYVTQPEIESLLSLAGFTVFFVETITPGKRRYIHILARKERE
jgi:SAM-dependent methyltransferase